MTDERPLTEAELDGILRACDPELEAAANWLVEIGVPRLVAEVRRLRAAISGDPWADFLHHRAVCIDALMAEGKPPDEIARAMSMDGDQVLLIAIRHRIGARP